MPREGAYLGVSAVTPADAKAAISRLIGRISTSPSELPAHVHNPHCRAGCGLARTTFNHEPATSGRVLAAAKAGDTAALQAALYDGCSTEEADEVRSMLCRCCGATCVRLFFRGTRTTRVAGPYGAHSRIYRRPHQRRRGSSECGCRHQRSRRSEYGSDLDSCWTERRPTPHLPSLPPAAFCPASGRICVRSRDLQGCPAVQRGRSRGLQRPLRRGC